MITLKYAELLIKGIFIGLGKIIPGVSGSLIAMSLGVYEEAVERITYFFKDIPRNVVYFLSLGIGVMLSILFGSKIVLFFLNYAYSPTIFLFSGLVMGAVPTIRRKIKNKNLSYVCILLFSILFLNIILSLKGGSSFVYHNNIIGNFQVALIGFLEAFTMIVPGISGTSLFISLGYYSFIMELFSNIFSVLQTNIQIPLLFALFFLIGVYTISIFMHYLLEKKEGLTYTLILAFSYSALFFMLKDAFLHSQGIFDFLSAPFFFLLGFYLCKKIE